jgi:acetyl-CoA carboxylase biotin carboxylase subunit
VEVQVLGDGSNVIHLGTRDCSVQRRYQKLVEEAPAPSLSGSLRRALHEAGVKFASQLGYRGLGTVEFLVDRERDAFYFLEMNARIQVEHPVTELICGLDLVAEQIAVAEGRPLRLRQQEIVFAGHAIECRVNAEDWRQGFRPDPGRVAAAAFPAGDGLRVDTHIQAGASVPPNYDSLLAKVIVHGRDRSEAIARMQRALALCTIGGVATNIGLHEAVMADADFMAGGVDTRWLAAFLDRQPAREIAHG